MLWSRMIRIVGGLGEKVVNNAIIAGIARGCFTTLAHKNLKGVLD